MKKVLLFIVLLIAISSSVWAGQASLVNGAGTLPQGDMGFSLDLGFDMPEPIVTAVTFDYGVTERLQLGVNASYGGLMYGGGLRSAYQFWQSEDESHFLAFRFSPSYVSIFAWIAELEMLVFDPTVAYEYRWGEKKGGVFVKAGTQHDYVVARSDVLNALFDASTADQSFWSHAIRSSVGVQQQIGDHFSVTLEAAYFFGLSKIKNFPGGKLGLTWTF